MGIEGKVLMERYNVGRFLGQGSYAKVYHARSLETKESVAVKVIDKDRIRKSAMEPNILCEVTAMRNVKHPNIVGLHEVMATKKKIYLVLEYVKGGELFGKVKKGRLDEETARKYFRQLISAVDFCHSRGVYHRDLKLENLLLDEDGNLKVADFGLSAIVESKRRDRFLYTVCGTACYVAPEVYKKHGYDGAKADIFSCGVILFVLLAGYLPFRGLNDIDMYRKMVKGDIHFPPWFSSGARKMVSRILQPDPEDRISILKIRNTSWFRKGFESKPKGSQNEEPILAEEVANPVSPQPSYLNAFDIISLSKRLNVSGLFEESQQKKGSRFMSLNTAKTIVSKLEDVAKRLKLKVVRKEKGLVTLEGEKQGRKGIVSIDAEVFEFAPNLHMVEFNKANGDTFEYERIMKRDIRPALKDIVWAWQGEPQPQRQQEEGGPEEVVVAPCA